MNNSFVKENGYCGKCEEYNSLIRNYIESLGQNGLTNVSLGMSLIIDDIMENNGGKTPNCTEDMCDALVNIYDNDTLLKMQKSFDLVDKGKNTEAIKQFNVLKKKYAEKKRGDS
ncbi:MAG: hypothetical protein KAS04_01420 [Candidatus Aenigmarchaeota archaeon]|nr:hypothetical protein [Candidatus Aenigmarchaeota archaeon]